MQDCNGSSIAMLPYWVSLHLTTLNVHTIVTIKRGLDLFFKSLVQKLRKFALLVGSPLFGADLSH